MTPPTSMCTPILPAEKSLVSVVVDDPSAAVCTSTSRSRDGRVTTKRTERRSIVVSVDGESSWKRSVCDLNSVSVTMVQSHGEDLV